MQFELLKSASGGRAPGPDDHYEQRLDLNAHLVAHPAATFFVRRGQEILVVDRSLSPHEGDTVIAIEEGELKTAVFRRARAVDLWGVVTYAIRHLRPGGLQ